MLNYLLIDVDRLNPAGPGQHRALRAGAEYAADGVQIGQDLDVIALRTSSIAF